MTSQVLALVGARGLVVGVLLPLAIAVLVAYGVFELLRSREVAPAAGSAAAAPAPALAILDERFARGEIDAEEYVQRRSLLAPGAGAASTPEPSVPPPPDPEPPTPDATAEQAVVGPDAGDDDRGDPTA